MSGAREAGARKVSGLLVQMQLLLPPSRVSHRRLHARPTRRAGGCSDEAEQAAGLQGDVLAAEGDGAEAAPDRPAKGFQLLAWPQSGLHAVASELAWRSSGHAQRGLTASRHAMSAVPEPGRQAGTGQAQNGCSGCEAATGHRHHAFTLLLLAMPPLPPASHACRHQGWCVALRCCSAEGSSGGQRGGTDGRRPTHTGTQATARAIPAAVHLLQASWCDRRRGARTRT